MDVKYICGEQNSRLTFIDYAPGETSKYDRISLLLL
jgi:hypothetical protein